MGLFQFRRMPFGLTGAPSSFQRLMDKIFRGLPFVTTYLDDILIHSTDIAAHEEHLRQVFHRIRNAGLTLRGRKCHIVAVLEQGGHVVAYASRSLSKSEKQYSVIQKECLAAIYGMKHYYLLGRFFILMTDHKPLQWLFAQKMEGLLCRWALAMQEYDFKIVYRQGSQNANADALSRCPMVSPPCCGLTMALPDTSHEELRIAQCQDPLTKELYNSLQSKHTPCLLGKTNPTLRRYKQIWPQLKVIDGIVCREYHPSPSSGQVTVPILPASLHHQALIRNHNIPSAGHQGMEKTLERLRLEAYWVNMARDVERHC